MSSLHQTQHVSIVIADFIVIDVTVNGMWLPFCGKCARTETAEQVQQCAIKISKSLPSSEGGGWCWLLVKLRSVEFSLFWNDKHRQCASI